MTNRRKGAVDWIVVALIVLGVVVVILGVMVYNLHSNMAIIDGKGRALREWTAKSATWSTHVHADHDKHHANENVAPDHIAPPPDPPPDW